MTTETYRIDEAQQRVWLTENGKFKHGFSLSFGALESLPPNFLKGCPEYRHMSKFRREAYSIARDELIDRGLIRDTVKDAL